MSTFELLDELEAGELSIQYEGEEPQALLEWALEEFAPNIAISAAFQADDVDNAGVFVGEAVGLIRDVAPAGEILRRMVREAEELLGSAPDAVSGSPT